MYRLINIMFVAFLLSLGTQNATATGSKLQISKTVIINTSPEILWAVLGDFNSLDKWHPAVVKSTLQGKGINRGDIRILVLGDGALIHDELIQYNNDSMSYTYKLGQSPLPVTGYVGTLKIDNNAQGTSTVTWFSSFNANGVSDEEAIEIIGGIYATGLNALIKLY